MLHEIRDPHALKAGTAEGIAINSSGDEFFDDITRRLHVASAAAEDASKHAEAADRDYKMASLRLTALRAASDAYRAAMTQGFDEH